MKDRKVPVTVTLRESVLSDINTYLYKYAPHLTRSSLVEYALLSLFRRHSADKKEGDAIV